MAQEHADATDFIEELYRLEEFLKQETSIASHTRMSARESPGVITILSEEEIRNSGARDLLELLMLVPGFSPSGDVQGVAAIGSRGLFGGVLLRVDGQEFNEIMFSTLQLGNRVPLAQVQRIEIIRGPGSAIYGGFAEMAVINVITKAGNGFEGLSVTGSYSQTARSYGRRGVSAAYGTSFGDLKLGLSAAIGEGKRSDRVYNDLYGGSFDMAQNANVDPKNVNFSLGYKGFSLRLMFDDYSLTQRDGFDVVMDNTERMTFRSYFAEAAYDHDIADNLKLSTRLNYKLQQPWHNRNPELDPVLNYNYYDKVAQRSTARVGLTWDVTDKIHLMAGGEFNYDHGNAEWMPEERYFGYTSPTVDYLSAAALAEGTVETDWVNITAGARFEAHSQFGSAFVPRVALTKVFNPFHVKLMVSRAYRAPTIEHMALSPDLKPEFILVGELEVGYQINRSMLVTASVFDITLDKPIVYVWDPVTLTESYQNQDSMGSRGAELEYRYQGEFGYAIASYSFYTTTGKETIDWNRVPQRGDMTLAFPKHKLTLMGSANITRDFSINPSVVVMSKRYGNVKADEAGVPEIGEYPAVTLVNVFLQYRNAFTPGLDIGVGVNNLLNADAAIIQAYQGTKAPYPGLSREAQVRLSWSY